MNTLVPDTAQGFNLERAYREFERLKEQETKRNRDYYLLRQAVDGNFRWPRDWPRHIPRLTHNLCKPVTERFVTYLLGKGFSWNIERPNNLEYRQRAERAEKILSKLLKLAKAEDQFDMAGATGSQLGRSIFKVYVKNRNTPAAHACFSYCQPDYFYGVSAGDNNLGEFSVVYYSYPIDVMEAKRLFGDLDFKSEADLDRTKRYPDLTENNAMTPDQKSRRVPVLEIWSQDSYALVCGGQVVTNGPNPFRWSHTGEGFIPFVVIENIRKANAVGEADIGQGREINEAFNQLLSRKSYIVNRWLIPTLIWKGAPQNAAEIVSQTLGGGGLIPTGRIDAELSFLAYDKPNPAVLELEQALRAAFLETCGMNEIALQGTVEGSINTGPSTANQYQPVLATIGKKQKRWESGLAELFAMLLEVQEQIGPSIALGEAVINNPAMQNGQFPVKSQFQETGDLVELSGEDISGLRDVRIEWPGVLPKDDIQFARFEMEKAKTGIQSYYTTLENLGFDNPDDEIARIRMENEDPSLKGQQVAEQMRSQAPLITAEANAAKQAMEMQQMAMAQGGGQQGAPGGAPGEEDPMEAMSQDPFAMMRDARGRGADVNMDGEEPVIGFGAQPLPEEMP